jgi:hypothetical protein
MATKKTTTSVDGQAPPRFIPSTRFTLGLLVFFAFIVQYSQRVNLPIAIVCMAKGSKSDDPHLSPTGTSRLPYTPSYNARYPSTTIKPANISIQIQKGGIFQEKQFYWSELQQQVLLGGYWAGYIFTQIPGKYRFFSLHNHSYVTICD